MGGAINEEDPITMAVSRNLCQSHRWLAFAFVCFESSMVYVNCVGPTVAVVDEFKFLCATVSKLL